jgi:hypothetical protein
VLPSGEMLLQSLYSPLKPKSDRSVRRVVGRE